MANICHECEDPIWTGKDPIKVPRLPVDGKVLEFDTFDDFPETGESGFIYIDLENNNFYKWDIETGEYTNIGGVLSDSDVVDIVNTYQELLDYDTSKLKDRDIVKVLEDESHEGKVAYYRWLKGTNEWSFVGAQGPYYTQAQIDDLLDEKVDVEEGKGLSTNDYSDEEKAKLGGLAEIKTIGDNLNLDENGELSAEVGVKILTADDYNWPEGNPTEIALWELGNGLYITNGSLRLRHNIEEDSPVAHSATIMVQTSSKNTAIYQFDETSSSADLGYKNAGMLYVTNHNTGHGLMAERILHSGSIINSLTENTAGGVLDARQGKVLKELIDGKQDALIQGSGIIIREGKTITYDPNVLSTLDDLNTSIYGVLDWINSLIIKDSGAPTTETIGTVGKLYEDTTNGKLYQCTAVSGGTYTWEEVGGGEEPYELPETFGSQVTGMAYGDSLSGDDVFELFGGSEGFSNFVDAVKSGKEFVTKVYDDLEFKLRVNQIYSVDGEPVIVILHRPMLAAGGITTEASIAIEIFDPASPNLTVLSPIKDFVGTDSYANGVSGLVPAPATTDVDKFLKSDGTWAEVGNDGLIIGGNTPPTMYTVGEIGSLYSCVVNGEPRLYMCTNISGGIYSWTKYPMPPAPEEPEVDSEEQSMVVPQASGVEDGEVDISDSSAEIDMDNTLDLGA